MNKTPMLLPVALLATAVVTTLPFELVINTSMRRRPHHSCQYQIDASFMELRVFERRSIGITDVQLHTRILPRPSVDDRHEHAMPAAIDTRSFDHLVGGREQRRRHSEAEHPRGLGVPSRWGCYHAPPLTDPYVPISSIRFFTGELHSQQCFDGRSGPLVTDAALGGRGSDPK
jgi:hypothetical protein